MAGVVEALGGSILDGPVHALDLTVPRANSPPDCFLILVTPRVVRLDQTVLDPILSIDAIEQMAFALFGPIHASATNPRFFHFCTVVGLTP